MQADEKKPKSQSEKTHILFEEKINFKAIKTICCQLKPLNGFI